MLNSKHSMVGRNISDYTLKSAKSLNKLLGTIKMKAQHAQNSKYHTLLAPNIKCERAT